MEHIIGPVKKNNLRKIAVIFSSISLNMCFGCSKEPSHRDGSFEYPQHMFRLRNKKIIFSYALLSWGLTHCIRRSAQQSTSASVQVVSLRSLTHQLTDS